MSMFDITRAFKSTYPSELTLRDVKIPANEIVLYYSGKSIVTIDNKQYNCEKGYVYYNVSQKSHDHFCQEKQDYLCFSFLGEFDKLKPAVYNCNGSKIIALINDVWSIFKKKNYLYKELSATILHEILILLAIESRNINLKFSVEDLIESLNNFNNLNLTVAEMAEKTSYSYDRFRHKFKEITGVPAKDFLLKQRINYSKTLLAKNTYTIAEIALICGFSDVTKFDIQFKKQIRLTPKQYANYINHSIH